MKAFSRTALCVFCLLVIQLTATAQVGLFVSVFDKPVPETKNDLLAIQRRAIDIAKKVIPCTVALQVGNAMGSGVVISEDGYILTAAHVVTRPGREVTVNFPDGRTVAAISLGMHTAADGALVKITDEGEWPFVPLVTKTQAPQIGEWCLATGHPNGFDPNREPPVRVGRVVDISSTVLQTDCPITTGDSGGPLVDMQGRVIGIHSRITESLTENYHVPGLAYREAWEALVLSKLYPKPIPSRFLALLDQNEDGQLTKDELKSEYQRRVYDRLIGEFELDSAKPLTLEKIATEKLKWQAVPAGVVELNDFRDLGEISLASNDFVRGPRLSGLFRGGLSHAKKVTVRVYSDGRRVALGTVIDADGLVLTKASRLEHGDIECLLPDGRRSPAELVATDSDYDLALLRVEATKLVTPDWATASPQPGSWVTIPNTNGRLASLGVVAVPPREIRRSRALLGIMIDQQIISEAVVIDVVGRSGAETAGIEVGDVVLEVAGNRVASLDDIRKALNDYQAGNTVPTVVRRASKQLELDVLLRAPTDLGQYNPRRQMDGRKSLRRDGFKSAFQMDAILKPELCGGPVVDVSGKIIGVTLARANRVASYAVAYEDLKPVIERLRARPEPVKTNATWEVQ